MVKPAARRKAVESAVAEHPISRKRACGVPPINSVYPEIMAFSNIAL